MGIQLLIAYHATCDDGKCQEVATFRVAKSNSKNKRSVKLALLQKGWSQSVSGSWFCPLCSKAQE